jgi:hypothetical protein
MVCSRRLTLTTNLDPERVVRIQGVLESVKGFVQSPGKCEEQQEGSGSSGDLAIGDLAIGD